MNLDKLQLRLQKGASVKHNCAQRMRQARRKAGCVALTVFTTQKDQLSRVECIPKDTRSEGTQVQERIQNPLKFDLKEVEPWMVRTTGTVKIAPRVKQIVVGRLEMLKRRVSPQLVCVGPAQLTLEGVLVARGLTRLFAKETERARQQ